jgi:hypothetical protein
MSGSGLRVRNGTIGIDKNGSGIDELFVSVGLEATATTSGQNPGFTFSLDPEFKADSLSCTGMTATGQRRSAGTAYYFFTSPQGEHINCNFRFRGSILSTKARELDFNVVMLPHSSLSRDTDLTLTFRKLDRVTVLSAIPTPSSSAPDQYIQYRPWPWDVGSPQTIHLGAQDRENMNRADWWLFVAAFAGGVVTSLLATVVMEYIQRIRSRPS